MSKEKTTTTFDTELKAQMMLQGIQFTEALRVGAEILLQVDSTEEGKIIVEMDKIKKEVNIANKKYNLLEKKLNGIKKKQSKEKKIKEAEEEKKKNSCTGCKKSLSNSKVFKIGEDNLCENCFKAI